MEFKSKCKRSVASRSINTWTEQVQNIHSNPILRAYYNFKHTFWLEIYLDSIKNHKYTVAMSQLRTSSHTMAIEYGKYTRPDLKRKLKTATVLFVMFSKMRDIFLWNVPLTKLKGKSVLQINTHCSKVYSYECDEKFLFLMCSKDQQILTWVDKFIHKSFIDRAERSS